MKSFNLRRKIGKWFHSYTGDFFKPFMWSKFSATYYFSVCCNSNIYLYRNFLGLFRTASVLSCISCSIRIFMLNNYDLDFKSN